MQTDYDTAFFSLPPLLRADALELCWIAQHREAEPYPFYAFGRDWSPKIIAPCCVPFERLRDQGEAMRDHAGTIEHLATISDIPGLNLEICRLARLWAVSNGYRIQDMTLDDARHVGIICEGENLAARIPSPTLHYSRKSL